jgi:hypothetical protein
LSLLILNKTKNKKNILTAAAVFAFGFSNANDAIFGLKAGLDNLSYTGGSGSITGFFIYLFMFRIKLLGLSKLFFCFYI